MLGVNQSVLVLRGAAGESLEQLSGIEGKQQVIGVDEVQRHIGLVL